MNPRDSIVLYTDLDDQRDKLAVDSRKYCQLGDSIEFIGAIRINLSIYLH